MEGKKRFSWQARGRSFVYAWRGIGRLLAGEHNCRLHAAAAAMAITAGALLGISRTQWAIVALCIGGVFAAEGFNSAIEALADKVSPEYDPLIEKGKDMAAGAVLLAAIGAAVAGILIFLPPLIALFTH